MKILKIVSCILVLVLMSVVLPSCAEVVTVDDVSFAAIVLDPEGNKELLVNVLQGNISGTEENMPTVLDAVIQLLEENGVAYKSDGEAITKIKNKEERSIDGYFYVWEYKINGEAPVGERAFEIEVKEGDHIVYYFTPAEDTSADQDAGGDVAGDVVE